MGRAIVNKENGMKTAGPANSYLKKGGTSKMKKGSASKMMSGGMMKEPMMKIGGKTSTKMMYGGMKKGGTKKRG
jgi:hypothetical protein